jgi:autotransporter-associated beta strand protein
MRLVAAGQRCRSSRLYLGAAGLWCFIIAAASAQQLAFPGAEGFGAYARGGRSGTVYHVTNLANTGSGSFRDAVSQPNRTIVFDVSGTIFLTSDLNINRSNTTVAGQTAPGDGITLKGRTVAVSGTHDVVVRFIHCRAGDTNCPSFQGDAFDVNNSQNVIVDHVSATWSIDEALSVTASTNITVQWSMAAEPLRDSCHTKGSHGYCSLLRYGKGGLSFHHNLYAHSFSRNPRLGDSIHLDWVNNVLYNWEEQAGYNEGDGADNPGGYTNFLNYVCNYAIGGTNTPLDETIRRLFYSKLFDGAWCQIYQSDNLTDTNKNGVLDGVALGQSAFVGQYTTNFTRLAFPQVNTDNATTAYVRVLSAVGPYLAREAVDTRIVNSVINQNGSEINSQNQVGGWPVLNSLPAPADTDQDGMPDYWEAALSLNSTNAADRNDLTSDGYTRLEQYLNWLAGPHARSQTNSVAYADLKQYTAGVQNPVYTVSSASNGVVVLLADGRNAQFTPTPGFSGLASFQFETDGFPAGLTGIVTVVVTPLNVSPNLVWRGDGISNYWDNIKSTNWLNGVSAVKFYAGDNVTFGDTGSNSPAINLVETLLPSSVIVTAAQNYTFGGSGSLGGMMSLLKSGSGQLTVTTSNTYGGGTTVNDGALVVNNTAGSATGTGAVTVASAASLGGGGIIGGPVTVNGTLVPGSNPGALTINNNLVVNGGAVLQYALGTNGNLTVVTGDLTAAGTLNVTDAGGFTSSNYTLFTYGGAFTNNGLSVGSAPGGYNYVISTNTPGQVDLVVTPIYTPFQQWQVDYFGATNNPDADPNMDFDGDGQNNLAEFLSGTSPTNSASALRIISAVRRNTDVVIAWTTAGGYTNAVQATSGDVNGSYATNFVDITAPPHLIITGAGDSATNYVDEGGATNSPSRFYRIRLVP